MIVLKRELTIESFFWYDLDTALGITEFNKSLNNVRRQLYSEIPSALDKELNTLGNENYEYDNYVVEYKKQYWNEARIIAEMYSYRVNGLYLFRGEWLNYDMFRNKVLSREPFDLYLYIKTIDEYKWEELTKVCKEKGLVPIKIKDNYKKKGE